MSSSDGADSHAQENAAAAKAAVIEAQEHAAKLQTFLQESLPPTAGAKEMMSGMMSSLSSAMSALDTGCGATAAGGQSSGGKRKKAMVIGPHRRSSFRRRRSQCPFRKTITTKKQDDGWSWRKYGQKTIQNSSHPRSYYRCTHKIDQGCKATRQVQVSETNPSEFVITYFGDHTCRDPSTIPLIIEAACTKDCRNLISFGSNSNTNSSAATEQLLSPFVQHCSPLAQEGASEEVLSRSLTPADSSPAAETFVQAGQLAAVVGSAERTSSTVGSASDWGELGDVITGGAAGSFCSSPSSLGFMAGSFGDGGVDDLFGFDF